VVDEHALAAGIHHPQAGAVLGIPSIAASREDLGGSAQRDRECEHALPAGDLQLDHLPDAPPPELRHERRTVGQGNAVDLPNRIVLAQAGPSPARDRRAFSAVRTGTITVAPADESARVVSSPTPT